MIWTRQWGASDGSSKTRADPHLRRLWCGRDDIGLHYEGNLEQMGAEVQVYLPNRFRRLWSQWECSQLLYRVASIDCHSGQCGQAVKAWAMELIRDDHHSMPEVFTGCICDHSSGASRCDYPFHYLAGCGVALLGLCQYQSNLLGPVADHCWHGQLHRWESDSGQIRSVPLQHTQSEWACREPRDRGSSWRMSMKKWLVFDCSSQFFDASRGHWSNRIYWMKGQNLRLPHDSSGRMEGWKRD